MRFSVQILRLPFFVYHLISTFTFFTLQKRTSKSGVLEILPSRYILSLKPKEKGD